MLSFLSSLLVSIKCILDDEVKKFYDKSHQLYEAALLIRCYTQHALRPFIDSEVINKGINFIDLPSIFGDRSVISSIPDYFKNKEPPIICYKYNKPIRNTIFNFDKLVSDLIFTQILLTHETVLTPSLSIYRYWPCHYRES